METEQVAELKRQIASLHALVAQMHYGLICVLVFSMLGGLLSVVVASRIYDLPVWAMALCWIVVSVLAIILADKQFERNRGNL